jgi:hypothetical protein
MKNIDFSLFNPGGTKLLIQILCCLICTEPIFAQAPKIKFKIKDDSDSIYVTTKIYSLTIDKRNADAHLKNWQGISYTSFPLDVQYNLAETRDTSHINRQWKIKDKKITSTAVIDGFVVQEIKITCFEDAFEVQLSSLSNDDSANNGAYLLRRNDKGFDTADWDQYFSPEPDEYFKLNPTVDIRVDRDQQWVFTPAPLNLSFKTAAGWFSIGLAELPNASIFAFRNKAPWLDFPWDKIQSQNNQLFRFPPLIFTFNESPWEAVGDYSNYLMTKYRISVPGEDQRPGWWKRPIVSTWGEQRVQQITYAHPDFNRNWLKNYVEQQQQALDSLKFNLIIENKWTNADGDPTPSDRFHDLRNLVDWCHDQGLKVILFWKAWKVEANSLPIRMGIFDGEYVDATHPLFENYVDSCCQVLFGEGPDQLNADGLKIDQLFLSRDPAKANYAVAGNGIGFREAHRYLQTFYQTAKKYKPDALIMSSAIDPHFADVQDMVRINDDWDHKTIREKRARIIIQAMPGILINGDAADLLASIALYHYVTSAVYGIPSIQYLTRFQDAAITGEMKDRISNLLKLYQLKPEGKLIFVDYGNWQILDKNDEKLAESIPGGKGLLIFEDKDEASLLCIENSKIHIVFDRHLLKTIYDENGNKIPFVDMGHGLYELENAELGKIYTLHLRKISTKRR